MADKYHKTVNGWQGYQIRKLIAFIFDVNPSSYKFDDKEKAFVFYIDGKAIDGEKRDLWKRKIEKEIGVTIIGI